MVRALGAHGHVVDQSIRSVIGGGMQWGTIAPARAALHRTRHDPACSSGSDGREGWATHWVPAVQGIVNRSAHAIVNLPIETFALVDRKLGPDELALGVELVGGQSFWHAGSRQVMKSGQQAQHGSANPGTPAPGANKPIFPGFK
jgi:hypothetical protein